MRNRLPVGPGSRGGHWHQRAFRAAYFRHWRATHPDYVENDRRRRLLTHAITRLTRVARGGAYSRP